MWVDRDLVFLVIGIIVTLGIFAMYPFKDPSEMQFSDVVILAIIFGTSAIAGAATGRIALKLEQRHDILEAIERV
jgi:hypothetical protein